MNRDRSAMMAENQPAGQAFRATKNAASRGKRRFRIRDTQRGDFLVLCRPGSDLLSQGLSHSTIGAEEFNGRVRDGIGFRLLARTTRPAKDRYGIRSKRYGFKEKRWSFRSHAMSLGL